jgi:hypothetical protein
LEEGVGKENREIGGKKEDGGLEGGSGWLTMKVGKEAHG